MSTPLNLTFPHLSICLKNEQTLQKLSQWVQVTTNEVKHEEALLVGGPGDSVSRLRLYSISPWAPSL